MEILKQKFNSACNYIVTFLKWVFIAGITGLASGLIGTAFHKSIDYVTSVRQQNSWLIWLLPASGLIIVFLYKACKLSSKTGTDHVIGSVRSSKKVPFVMAPLIFISTVLTHLFGGSAGREGAALQLGGSIGSGIGRLFHLDERDMHLITLCGMSGVFSALFGTPLTAALFAMEVISVGIIYYSGLIPCLVSSLTAYAVSLFFGIKPFHFQLNFVPDYTFVPILQTIAVAALCAAVSILFCVTMRKANQLFTVKIKNEYLRIAVGGAAVLILTLLLGTRDYNGAGMNIVTDALNGSTKPEAFALKLLFTALTIGVGFKGGEIVPTFFIGSTFGCFVGGLLGLDPGFGAAIGLIALFCGVVNCPIASIVLSIELFGTQGLLLFAIACGVSYMLSGYYGLYSSQKIVYSKLKAEYINIHTK